MSVHSLAVAMVRRRGSATADLLLRSFAGVLLLGIIGSLLDPTVAALTPFVLYTLWTNGPHSAFLPGAYESVLLLYGQQFPPLLISVVGTIATLFIEWVNYHIYSRARDTRMVRSLTGGAGVQRITRMFARQPSIAIALCAFGLVPYTVARCLSVLSRYPVGRHLAATAVGRFPRLWVIAALGAPLALPRWLLLGAVLLSVVLAALLWLVGRRAPPCLAVGVRGIP
jgi:uncharacterized membrane protein YdjX (TVP38/TMEM64 family)